MHGESDEKVYLTECRGNEEERKGNKKCHGVLYENRI